MSVVLTGANGQVGSEIQKMSREYDFLIESFSRAKCDISDLDSVQKVLRASRPSAVINAAAYTAVDKAEEDAVAAYAINHIGSENLARVCAELDIPLLHISTDYVFDGNANTPYTENDDTNPQSVYGASKLKGEQAIINILPQHIILRTSWVFGAQGNNFVKTMIRLAGARRELGVVNDQMGCPTPAKSIAGALLSISLQILNGNTKWGVYHFCGAPDTSWYGFANAVFDIMAARDLAVPDVRPIKTEEYPLPAPRPAYSVLNCEKIRDAFNIEQPQWKMGLKDVLTEVLP